MVNDQPTIEEQMQIAVGRQMEHARASNLVNRIGWTRRQWLDDVREQFEHIDGSILDLVNGHVMALLAEIDDLSAAPRYAAALHAMTCDDNPGHQDWHDCATTGPCAEEGQRLVAALSEIPS